MKLCLTLFYGLWLATLSAATCDGTLTNCQTAVNAASDGDTITATAGGTWTSALTITGKAITFKGQGGGGIQGFSGTSAAYTNGAKTFTTIQSGLDWQAGDVIEARANGNKYNHLLGTVTSYSGTTLVINVTSVSGSGTNANGWYFCHDALTVITFNCADNATMFDISEATTGNVRIQDLKIDNSTGTTAGKFVHVSKVSGGQPVIFQRVWFSMQANGTGIGDFGIQSSSNRIIVSHCSFDDSYSQLCQGIQIEPEDGTYDGTSTLGVLDTTGTNNAYLEDSWAVAVQNLTDWSDSARAVARYSYFLDSGIGTHGQDSGVIGIRHGELYNTEFRHLNATLPVDYDIYIRGGTFRVTDNIFDTISCGGACTKASVKVQVQALRRNAGPDACWHNDGTISRPVPHQFGWGRNLAGTADLIDPAYFWSNTNLTLVLNDYSPNECGGSAGTIADYVRAGIEYFIDGTTPSPSFTKGSYPHPLLTGVTTPPLLLRKF